MRMRSLKWDAHAQSKMICACALYFILPAHVHLILVFSAISYFGWRMGMGISFYMPKNHHLNTLTKASDRRIRKLAWYRANSVEHFWVFTKLSENSRLTFKIQIFDNSDVLILRSLLLLWTAVAAFSVRMQFFTTSCRKSRLKQCEKQRGPGFNFLTAGLYMIAGANKLVAKWRLCVACNLKLLDNFLAPTVIRQNVRAHEHW